MGDSRTKSPKILLRPTQCLHVSVLLLLFIFLYAALLCTNTISIQDLCKQKWKAKTTKSRTQKNDTFKDLTGKGYFTFHNLCIEVDSDHGEPIRATSEGHASLFGKQLDKDLMGSTTFKLKKLVVYGSNKTETKKIKPRAGPQISAKDRIWTIHHSTAPLPSTHQLITDYAAYFVSTTCEGNIYHFWRDTAVGLFGALKKTNRLNSSGPNQLYYRNPIRFFPRKTTCNNPDRFQDFLFAFGLRHNHLSFHEEKPNICFKNAVFGFYEKPSPPPGKSTHDKAAQYVMDYFGADRSSCGEHPVITIIQRVTRKILNLDQIKKYLDAAGISSNIKVFIFEQLTLQEQTRVIACTDVLVGVQGAGLEWMYFMQKGKALLELSWPLFHWPFMYDGRARKIGLITDHLAAERVSLNWTSFARRGIYNGPLTMSLKGSLKNFRGDWASSKNPWKFADAEFNRVKLKEKLKYLIRQIKCKN